MVQGIHVLGVRHLSEAVEFLNGERALRPVHLDVEGLFAQGAEYEFQCVSGDSVTLAPEGAVWLYHYNWGALHRFKLGDIHKGKARIELDAKSLEETVKPPSNTEAYVLVLEFPANRWYRSANIAPTNLLRDFLPALAPLGTLRESSSKSLPKLVLPAAARRRFQDDPEVPLISIPAVAQF